jgi:hypothetical protein
MRIHDEGKSAVKYLHHEGARRSLIHNNRVSSETSFVSNQPKLEPKQVSALSKTRRLVRFNIETGSFGVLKQPKQTKD